MAEEFEESDVIFKEDSEDINEVSNKAQRNPNRRRKLKKTNHTTNALRSAPVSIPQNIFGCRNFDDDFDCDDGEIVPPHVIIGRRLAGKMMSFSMCSGRGRTLKGRDLSQVRNTILRLTGFLEA